MKYNFSLASIMNMIFINTRILFIILLLILCFYICFHLWKVHHLRKLLIDFPSPPTVPILGNIHLICSTNQGRVKKFLNILRSYESPFVIWLSYLPIIILTKAEDISTVSSKCVNRDMMGIFRDSVGDGLVVAHEEKWKKIRKLINPAFSPSMLKQYLLVFNQQAQILVQKLATPAKSAKIFDIWSYMANASIDIITENVTGNKLETQENLGNEFSYALMETLRLESLRFMLPWLLSPSIFFVYRLFTGKKDLFRKLHHLPLQVLKQKKIQYFEQGPENLASNVNHPNTLIDILFRIKETNTDFTEQQMHDEMLNIISTGSESTAVMGSFILLMFALHEAAQEKAYQEILQVFNRDKNFLEMEDLNKLQYLEQCIKETLRVFTLFPITIRKTTEDIQLHDNRIIPANCQVGMALQAVHLDSKLYPNPRVWNPENFSKEAIQNRPKNSFVPFGLGPRACIGSKYATMSLKTQISYVIRNYSIKTNIQYTDIKPSMDAIVRSKNGYPVFLEVR